MAKKIMQNERKALPKVPNLTQDRKDYTNVMVYSNPGNVSSVVQQRMDSRYNESANMLKRSKKNDPYI